MFRLLGEMTCADSKINLEAFNRQRLVPTDEKNAEFDDKIFLILKLLIFTIMQIMFSILGV